MGASMRDPNFWKGQSKRYLAWGSWRFGIAFLVLALWNVAPTLGNVVPALGNFKFWFFRFRSPDLSQSISHMRMTRITIKTHPPPLLGSISRKIFATSKCCRFLSARPLTCDTNGTDGILVTSTFSTLKIDFSSLEIDFSSLEIAFGTLKFVSSTLKITSSTLKWMLDAFYHSETACM